MSIYTPPEGALDDASPVIERSFATLNVTSKILLVALAVVDLAYYLAWGIIFAVIVGPELGFIPLLINLLFCVIFGLLLTFAFRATVEGDPWQLMRLTLLHLLPGLNPIGFLLLAVVTLLTWREA
ncbi:hypothetical protein [Halioxenophilus sp. WMMB6]|uniref:hypothetical protein n=1 Tax=Halioxenophilus sp. WMMB6 TaxID=3073815 RepID=UPI00295EDB91|nr:hypothetical protein [Halioxenophilus sp. WMMB6]